MSTVPRIRRPLVRTTIRCILSILLVRVVTEVFIVHHRLSQAAERLVGPPAPPPPTRLFIAALHWNNEPILRSHWNDAVVEVAKAFGPENVFVSVYESGSWDNSKGALSELDRRLGDMGVQKRIILDKTTHKDEMQAAPSENGWIETPRGATELRRIPYLSRLRKISLSPLLELSTNGTQFDQVLFLGDVVFTVSDVITLLNTNSGHYAAACALDFSKPPAYYDTFALRDSSGHEHVSQTWPYFRSSKSRSAVKASKPVPVSSCWNGLVTMPAATFTGEHGLSFRGIDDSLAEYHLEASECCLVHADNPASATKGVFLNPNVRVGYNGEAYRLVHPGGSWLSHGQIWAGIWRNRIRRWFTTPLFKEFYVRRLVSKWERLKPGRQEQGDFCMINEMQVLVENGWAHV